MNPEDVFLWFSLAALLTVVALRIRTLRRPHLAAGPIQRLVAAAAASLFVATLLLTVYFAATRFSIEYVFSYTSRGTPLHYRLAGLWGGQKGTLLLWTAFGTLFLWINARGWRLRRGALADPSALDRSLAWTELVAASILAAMTAMLLAGGVFERTDPYLLQARPDGTGLQPVLRTPFMLIHPPLQFVAYAFSILLFAMGITALTTRDKIWADMALPWTRWAFVITFSGLGLGGLWAYYVLNFGGYWAWDPVETANLLAWFPVLLLLHAVIYYRKRGSFAAAAPVFAVLTLLADLFATLSTRTGLWVSVHAFTDPSRNFAVDPLQRLLNILDTGVLLRWLAAIFVACILAVLAAYLHRLGQESQGASGKARVGRGAIGVGQGMLASLALLAFLDARFVVSAIFQLADVVAFGNAPLGLGLLGFGVALLVAAPRGEPTAPGGTGAWREWVRRLDTGRWVFVGMMVIALAFLVIFLLQILSVNGYTRSVYDQRVPLLILPVLLVMPAALTHPTLGLRWTVTFAATAAAVGIALALAFRDSWQVWILVPAFAWALFGTGLKLFKVSDPGRLGDPRLRAAGGALLLGGILNMVYWSNPPSRIPLLFVDLHPSAWWAPVGIGLGLAGTLSAIGVLRAKTVRAHRIGGLATVLGFGFGVSSLLGIVAIVLGERARKLFPDLGKPFELRACASSLRREIRKTGVYTMHVAIVLGLLGYTLSTYAQQPETEIMLGPESPVEVHGYTLRLVGSEAGPMDPDQATLTDVSALVEVSRDGKVLETVPLTMWLELFHHYAERVSVERFWIEDLYLRPVMFVTSEQTFLAHEDNVVLTRGHVERVVLTAKTLPAMHLVWGSLWTVVAGMFVNLAAGASSWEFSRPKSAAPVG